MGITFKEIPGWNFEVDEVSAGVYKVSGKDELGRSVEMTGTDPDALLEESKKYAEGILADSKKL
jgi:hypothetical protein